MVKNRALFYAVQKFLSDGTIENKRALKRAYYDLARPTYEFADVVRYLPFLATFAGGSTKRHIVNSSAYPVTTFLRTVYYGGTLCGRSGELEGLYGYNSEPCPGCHAVATGLAAKYLEERKGKEEGRSYRAKSAAMVHKAIGDPEQVCKDGLQVFDALSPARERANKSARTNE